MANIKDVAALAGVSVSTVSNVLNGTKAVSEGLKDKVVRAAKQLDYRPSSAARSLRGKGSGSIGLIVPDITIPFFSELVRGLEGAASRQDYSVVICSTGNSVKKEDYFLRMLRDRSVDGVVMSGVRGDFDEHTYIAERVLDGLPVAMVDRPIRGLKVDSVTIDNRLAAQTAAQHVLALGHKRVGFITGELSVAINQDRLAGYRDALESIGIPFNRFMVREGSFAVDKGYEHGLSLLAMATPPTVIMAANDIVAIGVSRAAKEMGLSIPHDLSVVGFDDLPISQFLDPPLTTVAQPVSEMGRVAFELVLRRISEPKSDVRNVVLDAELRVRESTAPAP